MFRERMKKVMSSKASIIIQILLIISWGLLLEETDAIYVNYVLIFVITGICLFVNIKSGNVPFNNNHDKRSGILVVLFSILFSCMIALANYKILFYTTLPEEYLPLEPYINANIAITLFIGGFCAFWNILTAIALNPDAITWTRTRTPISPKRAFVSCFLMLLITRIPMLLLCHYPGSLSNDSINQIQQIMSGQYTNHHPFYHTMLIKCLFSLGMFLFNDINAAVATFIMFQILYTSVCFSLVASTLAQMYTPRWIITTSILFFLLMPYHIAYAITMWKDVPFGCFILLFVLYTYRCLSSVGHTILNYVMLAISSLGICLFRSNGLFVFVLSILVFLLVRKLQDKKMLTIFIATIVISLFLKHPLLTILDVSQPDIVESLSIPVQQIARVIDEDMELEEWESDLLDQIIDTDRISDSYISYVSDPIKDLIREKGNQDLLKSQRSQYLRLYLSLGIKYPKTYLIAWIEQTRGYWNAGYDYSRWYLGITGNDLGIERTTRDMTAYKNLSTYLWLFTYLPILKPFLSTGLFVWMNLLALMIALIKKDSTGIIISVPVLFVALSLIIATPVSVEFRYIYSAFCTMPLLVVITTRPDH